MYNTNTTISRWSVLVHAVSAHTSEKRLEALAAGWQQLSQQKYLKHEIVSQQIVMPDWYQLSKPPYGEKILFIVPTIESKVFRKEWQYLQHKENRQLYRLCMGRQKPQGVKALFLRKFGLSENPL